MICDLMQQSFKKELIEKFYQADAKTVYTFHYNFVDAKMKPLLEKKSKPEYISLYEKLNEKINNLDPSLATQGIFITFIDLCEGGHVESTKEIPDGSFALDKIAGAYRQGKEGNPMMTRIYGLAFESKEELKNYQEMMEEAKKRDHRVLGQKMQIFAFDDEIGPGLPLWLPNGTIIVEEIEKLAKEKEHEYGYQRVRSPHITKAQLYLRS